MAFLAKKQKLPLFVLYEDLPYKVISYGYNSKRLIPCYWGGGQDYNRVSINLLEELILKLNEFTPSTEKTLIYEECIDSDHSIIESIEYTIIMKNKDKYIVEKPSDIKFNNGVYQIKTLKYKEQKNFATEVPTTQPEKSLEEALNTLRLTKNTIVQKEDVDKITFTIKERKARTKVGLYRYK